MEMTNKLQKTHTMETQEKNTMERKQHNSIGSITEKEYVGTKNLKLPRTQRLTISRDREGPKTIGLLSLRLHGKEHQCFSIEVDPKKAEKQDGKDIIPEEMYDFGIFSDSKDAGTGIFLPEEQSALEKGLVWISYATGMRRHLLLGDSIEVESKSNYKIQDCAMRINDRLQYSLKGEKAACKRMHPLLKEYIGTGNSHTIYIRDIRLR